MEKYTFRNQYNAYYTAINDDIALAEWEARTEMSKYDGFDLEMTLTKIEKEK